MPFHVLRLFMRVFAFRRSSALGTDDLAWLGVMCRFERVPGFRDLTPGSAYKMPTIRPGRGVYIVILAKL
jgi:hypothetical protein